MRIHGFDEVSLIADLTCLPPHFRVAFATACAERQYPLHVQFHRVTERGYADVLRWILNRMWEELVGFPMTDGEARLCLDVSLAASHMALKEWQEHAAYAEAAAESISCALRARLTGEIYPAARSGRRAYDALWHYLRNAELVGSGKQPNKTDETSQAVLKAEIDRQARDIRELCSVARRHGDFQDIAREFCMRSQAEAFLVFRAGTRTPCEQERSRSVNDEQSFSAAPRLSRVNSASGVHR